MSVLAIVYTALALQLLGVLLLLAVWLTQLALLSRLSDALNKRSEPHAVVIRQMVRPWKEGES